MKRLTRRLVIRNLSEADYPEFEQVLNDAQKSTFGCGKEFLKWVISQYDTMNITNGSLCFGIFER